MNSLQELNGYASTSIKANDDRPADFTLGNVTSPITLYKSNQVTTLSLTPGVDFETNVVIPDDGVLFYDTGNANISVTWPSVPGDLIVGNIPGNDHTYSITGAFYTSNWEIIDTPNLVLPVDYRSQSFSVTANLSIDTETVEWSYDIEYQPLIESTSGFRALSNTGAYTGSEVKSTFYATEMPYFDCFVTGLSESGFGGGNKNNIANVSVEVNQTGTMINENPIINLSSTDNQKNFRLENYYEVINFTDPIFTGTAGNVIVTATSNAGRTLEQTFEYEILMDQARWDLNQANWEEVFNDSDTYRFGAGYGYDGNTTQNGTIAGGRWTADTFSSTIEVDVNHYPSYGFETKKIVLSDVYIQAASISAGYRFYSEEYILNEAFLTDLALDIYIDGNLVISKSSGDTVFTTLPVAGKIDITNSLSTTSGHASEKYLLPIQIDANISSTYVDNPNHLFKVYLTFFDFEDYRIDYISGLEYGPDIVPTLDYNDGIDYEFQIEWIRD